MATGENDTRRDEEGKREEGSIVVDGNKLAYLRLARFAYFKAFSAFLESVDW